MPSPCRVARRSAEIGKDGTLEARRRGPDPCLFSRSRRAPHIQTALPQVTRAARCVLSSHSRQAGRQAGPARRTVRRFCTSETPVKFRTSRPSKPGLAQSFPGGGEKKDANPGPASVASSRGRRQVLVRCGMRIRGGGSCRQALNAAPYRSLSRHSDRCRWGRQTCAVCP